MGKPVTKRPDDVCTCGKKGLEPRKIVKETPWLVGKKVVRLQLDNVPVVRCQACGMLYRTPETEDVEQLLIQQQQNRFWFDLLKDIGLTPADIIKFKMCARKTTNALDGSIRAAEQFGAWLAARPSTDAQGDRA